MKLRKQTKAERRDIDKALVQLQVAAAAIARTSHGLKLTADQSDKLSDALTQLQEAELA